NNFASSLLLRTWLPYDWTPRSEAYFVFPLAQGTPGKQCGHAAGDKVLQAIAGVLQKHLGKVGIAGRTGGEEFTCFLPETDLETAIAVVRNCRNDIRPVIDFGKKIEVTLSYGLAVSHGEYKALDILVREADEALYEAKNQGRNQIITHNDVNIRKKA
ncbi:GGDEF domain-containing protein, partial [Thiolapillus sp.]|uniref:GGDEF domain-containing protein n=1 Tax=Thiolapillus sp. TaxID=2017437 RepID=UPI003AF7520B